ncbi:MAG: hypothetical protein Q7N50_05695 [Armatimonadota bacterium]|nr:hypothetical protein [Armatimonadota bacterium]
MASTEVAILKSIGITRAKPSDAEPEPEPMAKLTFVVELSAEDAAEYIGQVGQPLDVRAMQSPLPLQVAR